jgi:hypothetical protein
MSVRVLRQAPTTVSTILSKAKSFQSNYFDFAYDFFNEFLKKRIHEKNAEFYIPELIQELIDSQKISVDVIESPSTWFGVTYKEDKEHVQQSFNKMILNGYYPSIIHN